MLQLALWAYLFPNLRREHWISSGESLWHRKEYKRKCQNAFICSQRSERLACWRSVWNAFCLCWFCSSLLFLGSIPERDIESDKVYNTCTVYNPNGLIIVLKEVRARAHFCPQATLLRCIARFTCSISTFLARSNSRLNPVPRPEPL